MSLKAGVAKKDINPEEPMFLAGYPHVERISEGINDPLYASALYLDDGTNSVIMIAVDVLYVTAGEVWKCRKAINEVTGIVAENIMISATHTHSAPLTAEVLAWAGDSVVPEVNKDYIEYLCRGIIDAAIAAQQSAEEAVLAVTSAKAEGVGGNRLAKDGIHDSETGILYVKRKSDGKALGIALVYSMHPTVLHEDSKLVSSDFPGFAREYIVEQSGAEVVLYHTGPCGNLSPRYFVSGQTFAEAKRLGEKLGENILVSIGKPGASDFSGEVSLSSKIKKVQLPFRDFMSVSKAEAVLKAAIANYERLKKEKAGHGPIRTAECTIFGAEEMVTLAKAQESGEIDIWREKYNAAEVQVIRIGSNFIVGLPGEMFVEYGLEVKKRAVGKTFVVSLTNGELQGYITTDDATGYEANLSFFKPEAGKILVDTAIEMIQEMVIEKSL